MKNKTIRLNENNLRRLVKETIKSILKETYEFPSGPNKKNSDLYVLSICSDGDVFDCEAKPYENTFQDMKNEYERILQFAKEKNLKVKNSHIDKYSGEVTFDNPSYDHYWRIVPENEREMEQYGDPENDPEAYYDWENREKAYQSQAAQEAQYYHPQTTPKRNNSKLNESKLHRIVKESIKKVLKENANAQTYRGVPGSIYVQNSKIGEPTVIWKGEEFSVYELESLMWDDFNYVCEEKGIELTENNFEAWLKEMGTKYIISQLDDAVEYDL
jgi:hypothetical protein